MVCSLLTQAPATRAFSAARRPSAARRLAVKPPVAAARSSSTSAKPGMEFKGLIQPANPLSLNYGADRVRDPYFGKADWLDGTLAGDVGLDPLGLGKDKAKLLKNRERELFHGRLAMLGVSGAIAQENAGFGPWFRAGANVCAPVDWAHFGSWLTTTMCTVPGYYNIDGLSVSLPLGTIIFFEICLFGVAEVFRTGVCDSAKGPHQTTTLQMLSKNFPMDDIINGKDGRMYPGTHSWSFNPLGIDAKDNVAMLKVMEVKHSRLAMLAWLGFIVQAAITNPTTKSGAPLDGTWHGATDNWSDFVASPGGAAGIAALIAIGHIAPITAQNLDFSDPDIWQLWRAENQADGPYITRLPPQAPSVKETNELKAQVAELQAKLAESEPAAAKKTVIEDSSAVVTPPIEDSSAVVTPPIEDSSAVVTPPPPKEETKTEAKPVVKADEGV